MMEIFELKKSLEEGATILYNTDTVLGLGCDARSLVGIEKISTIKQRPKNKSYIVLVANLKMLEFIVGPVSKEIIEKMQHIERPTTFIFSTFKNLPDAISGHHRSIAIRWTQNKKLQEFIEELGFPLISTSANISGNKSPKNLEEVDEIIKNSVDIVLPHSFDGTGQASKIIKITKNGSLEIIRK